MKKLNLHFLLYLYIHIIYIAYPKRCELNYDLEAVEYNETGNECKLGITYLIQKSLKKQC